MSILYDRSKNIRTYFRNGIIRPDPDRVKSIKNLQIPRNKIELQQWLGIITYCRRFIKNISIICKPLYNLLKKEEVNTIKEQLKKKEVVNLFNEIKNLISEKTLLVLPDFTKEFILTIDASGIGCGEILSQNYNGVEKPIAFYSKLFNEVQERYSTTRDGKKLIQEAKKETTI